MSRGSTYSSKRRQSSKFDSKIISSIINYREVAKQQDLSEVECTLLWNLVPHSYDEAVTLIPSLKDKSKESVENLVETLNKFK